ncbi:hypothetical protein D3C72_1447540 [compost metagenome]
MTRGETPHALNVFSTRCALCRRMVGQSSVLGSGMTWRLWLQPNATSRPGWSVMASKPREWLASPVPPPRPRSSPPQPHARSRVASFKTGFERLKTAPPSDCEKSYGRALLKGARRRTLPDCCEEREPTSTATAFWRSADAALRQWSARPTAITHRLPPARPIWRWASPRFASSPRSTLGRRSLAQACTTRCMSSNASLGRRGTSTAGAQRRQRSAD